MRESDLLYFTKSEFNDVLHQLMASSEPRSDYLVQSLLEIRDEKSSQPPIAIVGLTTQMLLTENSDPHRVTTFDSQPDLRPGHVLHSPAVRWGLRFIKSFLGELRRILCGPKNKWDKLDEKSQSALASVAAMLGSHLGLPGALASGLATWILIALARAGKKSICEMTDEEVIRALAEEQ